MPYRTVNTYSLQNKNHLEDIICTFTANKNKKLKKKNKENNNACMLLYDNWDLKNSHTVWDKKNLASNNSL